MTPAQRQRAVRARREPPKFRRVAVRRVEGLTPRLIRVTLGGPELDGFRIEQPAASVRVLLPSSPAPGEPQELIMPAWAGNEFLLPDGRRPPIRTFTPRRSDPETLELDVEIVVHDGGAASDWVAAAEPGSEVAVAGPGRGYTIDLAAPAFCLAGDETAIPAIGQLLEALPHEAPVQVHIEVARPEARLDLPDHPRASIRWHDLPSGASPGDAVIAAVAGGELTDGARIWAAGEAAAMQRLRRHLFEDRGIPRTQTAVRGYWKHGRSGDADGDA